MIKYSIIIPIYNTEKFLKKCIDSVINQTLKDYEIILVNDGSKDNSEKIVKDYLKKYGNIKYIKQENKGLSVARNIGVKNAQGEYILFLDSDDYLNKDLLFNLSKVKNDPELIRYQVNIVYEDKEKAYLESPFKNLNGESAFNKISSYKYVELACLYAIKRKFYINNNYIFKEGLYHEDFGLIPRIIIESQSVTSIEYVGYNYIQRDNSIMNNSNYNKECKKAFDILEHYSYLIESKKASKTYLSFIANSVILKAKALNKKDYEIYINKLKEMKVFDNILTDTFIRKLKKMLMKFNLSLYLKVIK
ncbi:MAG: glycosyltransferase [Bacilli bacterium]|nr:glycosyltransferase [Bacilli bacterium]